MLDAHAEQRKHPRYTTSEGAIVTFKPDTEILGQLIDIGHGGLAFRYIDMLTDIRDPESGLVIFQPNPRVYLEGVPFRTVSDIAVRSQYSFSSLPIRRRSVAFGPLSPTQQDQLERLIRCHSAVTSTFAAAARRHPASFPPL